MKPRLSDLWRWDGTIERGGYIFWGVLLAAVKFNLDRFVGYYFFGKGWAIFDSEFLRLYLWQSGITKADTTYYATLLLISLPFIWAGTVLTVRRLRSIGMSPWWTLFFFVPLLKLVFFGLMCLIPSRPHNEKGGGASRWRTLVSTLIPGSKLGSALLITV